MLTKTILATLLTLSVTSSIAYARGDHNLRERETQTACERPAAPAICRD